MEVQNLPKEILVSDDYHGRKVEYPYRYIKNLEDTTVLAWYDSLTGVANQLLDSISSKENLLEKIKEQNIRSTGITRSPKFISNGNLFFLKYEESFTLEKLFYKKGAMSDEEIELFDPVEHRPEADEYYTIDYFEPSLDGSKVAVSLSTVGEEISEIIIIDTSSKKVYPDLISDCWPAQLGGVSWLPDNSGFIYSHIPVTDRNATGYLLNTESTVYKIGQKSNTNTVLFSSKNNPELAIPKELYPLARFSNSTNHFFGRVGGARDYDDYYYTRYTADFRSLQWKPLYKTIDQIESFEAVGDDLIYLTSKNASHFKICKTSLKKPDFENPTVLVEEDKVAIITDIAYTKAGLFYVKVKNGVEARVFHLTDKGPTNEIPLPKESGSIKLYSSLGELWIETLGWTSNSYERYIFNFEENQFSDFALIESKDSSSQISDLVVKEIEVESHDGIKVPLSIIYKEGVELNGNNRVLMTAYGAYGNSFPPYLSGHLSNWVELGGVYAVAHVRGGGEKGDAWHQGGLKATKPNSWKDFIACTEYLIDKDYTKSKYMAVWSTSAGGIVVGRAVTERPDLYAAAFVKSGMMNPIRSEESPNSPGVSEYGTVKGSLEFQYLYEMDPFHHIEQKERYPAILLTASLNDARVAAWNSGKFVARMMSYSKPKGPILLQVSKTGGHVGYDSRQSYYESLANEISFALWQTGHPDFQPE